jgi:hypothetical protein
VNAAAYALLSALAGAFGALVGVYLTHRFAGDRETAKDHRQVSHERNRWLRDEKRECYFHAVRSLIRLRSIGAQAKKPKYLKLPEDVPGPWFDEVAEANAWLTALHTCCGEEQYDEIGSVLAELANVSRWLVGFRPSGTVSSQRYVHMFSDNGLMDCELFVDLISELECAVSNCARHEFQLSPVLDTVDHSNKRTRLREREAV